LIDKYRTNEGQPQGSQTDYRELFERSADAILIIDDGNFVECNDATVRMLRYRSREELLQTHPSALSPEYQPDGRRSFEKANEMMNLAFEQGSHRFEWVHRRADGEVFPVEVLLTAMPRGDQSVLHVVWRDITERKKLEADLHHAQKMEAVGKLAGGIAHDFNNLLVSIIGHAELLELTLGGRPDCQEHLTEISRASDRAADLVNQLLAFSRKQVLQPRVVDLNVALAELGNMFDRLLGANVDTHLSLSQESLAVNIDPGQLEQVIVNLATNARDAMPAGGQLSFETSKLTLSEDTQGEVGSLRAGQYAVLAVADTGEGIDPKIKGQIFDPFFTTKEQGRGTGLGLATVYGIVKQSGGETMVLSTPGWGTVFRVFLPLSDRLPEPDERRGPTEDLVEEGHETILVAEDEPAVLSLAEQILSQHGYTVYTAIDGQAALELVEEQGLEFDMLLTDVVMPRMDGAELAHELRAQRPGLKVLFMSGYSNNALQPRGVLADDINLLSKPYTASTMLKRVRQVLDQA